jgi:hypothetical protein
MVHAFGGTNTKAVLHVEMSSGESYDINFTELHKMDMQMGIQESFPGITTLTLVGRAVSTPCAPLKKAAAKPAPKLKKPSVKLSATRVRKATVAHAKLTKKIFEAERALIALKNSKERGDVELKTAREQLLASATPEVR